MSEYTRRYPNGKPIAGRMNLLLSLAGRDLGESMLERVVQGSYNKGGVAASAGTHDGGGAVDLSVGGWSKDRIWQVLTALRKRGLIAWYRHPGQGFSPHIHGIDRGANDLSSGARQQVVRFDNGEDGLRLRQPDDGPKVPVPSFDYAAGLVEWSDPEGKEPDMKREYAAFKTVTNRTIPRGREVVLAEVDTRAYKGQAILWNAQFAFSSLRGVGRPTSARVRFVRMPAVDGTGELRATVTPGVWADVHNHVTMGGTRMQVRVTFPGKGRAPKLRYLHFKAVRFA